MLIAYYFMWHSGKPAPEQCEGCTFYTSQVRDLSFIHSRNVTYATFCQGPYEESARYRDFMGWAMPWYSLSRARRSKPFWSERRVGMMHSFATCGRAPMSSRLTGRRAAAWKRWITSYRLLDLTVYGRQEKWQNSPPGWPQQPKGKHYYRTDGRPIVQWPRVKAGHSDDLGIGRR